MSHLPKKILLATDGSEDARLAARAAASLAGNAGAELHVVHAWQSVPHPAIDADYYEEVARRVLEEQVEFVAGVGAAVSEGHLVMGAPVDVILDLAEEMGAELVVMGSRGHGTLERLLLGSVSEGVVHHATRPVLVMRGGESAWPPQRVVIGGGWFECREEGRGDSGEHRGTLRGEGYPRAGVPGASRGRSGWPHPRPAGGRRRPAARRA